MQKRKLNKRRSQEPGVNRPVVQKLSTWACSDYVQAWSHLTLITIYTHRSNINYIPFQKARQTLQASIKLANQK